MDGPGDPQHLTGRGLRELVAIEDIKALKYRYLRCVDLRLWDELAETLDEEVTADYGNRLSYRSRAEVVAGLRSQMTSEVITEHQVHHPEITLGEAGDTATGRWYLQDRVIVPAMGVMIVGGAFYEDAYAVRHGVWVITKTGYRRTWEASLELKDVPSFTLLENHLQQSK